MSSGEKVRLGSICSPKQWKSLKQSDMTECGYPVYGANGVIGHYPEYNHVDETILIGCRGTCGEVTICEPKSYVTSNAMCLDDLSDSFDMNFVASFLKAYNFQKIIGGTSQPQITKAGVSSIELPVFSLEEQRMITANLQAVLRQIDKCNNQIAQLDQLVKSRFVEMFGDPSIESSAHMRVAIGSFAEVQTGATPSRKEPKFYGGSILWVKTGEVARNFANGIEETISDLAIEKTNCKVFPTNTVLVAMYGQGDTRGKTAILPCDAATNQACAAILPSEKHDPAFLNTQLQLMYEDLRAKSLGGTQQNLSLRIVKAMKVFLPPLPLQQDFAAFAAQVDKTRAIAQQQVDKLQTLYDSLAQDYFS